MTKCLFSVLIIDRQANYDSAFCFLVQLHQKIFNIYKHLQEISLMYDYLFCYKRPQCNLYMKSSNTDCFALTNLKYQIHVFFKVQE